MKVMKHKMSEWKTDVLIPVYRPGKEFETMLERLEKQNYPIHQIILMHTIDGRDLTQYVKKYKNIRVEDISPEEFDHGGTRDKGMRISEADIVICMTQDACPADNNLITELVKAVQSPEVEVAYARQLPRKNATILEKYTRQFNYPEESRIKSSEDIKTLGIKTYFCSDVCAAYDRQAYIENDGFETKTIFNEDMIYAAGVIKRGKKVYYNAEAKVIHSHDYNFIQQLKRNFDMAVSQAQHPEVFQGISSEKEGMKLVKSTVKYLLENGKPLLIIKFFSDCVGKYTGYLLGKKYKKLPKKVILMCTMSPRYWK